MSEINAAQMATQLATAYTTGIQTQLTTQTKSAQARSTALTKLQTALQTFDTALSSLSAKKGVEAKAATFSATGFATATAQATAPSGAYSMFVEQVATYHQVAFEDLPAVPAASGGTLTVNVAGGGGFSVNLGAADADGNGTLSQAEIARAINQANGNGGKATAMIVTVGSTTQLVMTAGQSGTGGAVSLDTSAMPASLLKTALDTPKELVAAKDAIVWLGDQGTGVKVQQGSNTVTAIEGVTVNLTQAQAPGASPTILTVAGDDTGTASNVQGFVDAYNSLKKTLDELTDTGDAENGKSAAVFATDAGVRALRARLNSLVRQDIGGLRLVDFGVSSDRSGTLTLDTAKLKKGVAAHPNGLSTVFGSTSITARSGVLGTMDQYLDGWLNGANGMLKQRKDSVQNVQRSLTVKQTRLDQQYDSAYERYLQQFTRLNQLQSQMSETSGLLSSLFTTS